MWYGNFKEEISERVQFSNITQSYHVFILVETHPHPLDHTPEKHLNKKKSVSIKTV